MFQSAPPVKGATDERRGMPARGRFQSAPPVKGATAGSVCVSMHDLFQSAPPVKGATRARCVAWYRPDVSIRAPREGGDTKTHPPIQA